MATRSSRSMEPAADSLPASFSTLIWPCKCGMTVHALGLSSIHSLAQAAIKKLEVRGGKGGTGSKGLERLARPEAMGRDLLFLYFLNFINLLYLFSKCDEFSLAASHSYCAGRL